MVCNLSKFKYNAFFLPVLITTYNIYMNDKYCGDGNIVDVDSAHKLMHTGPNGCWLSISCSCI